MLTYTHGEHEVSNSIATVYAAHLLPPPPHLLPIPPQSGEIPPGDVAVFNWLFQPLEAKQYSVALPLGLGPAAPVPLLLRGRGYHPRQAPEQAAPTQEEAAQ